MRIDECSLDSINTLRLGDLRHDFDITGQLAFGDYFRCRAIVRANQQTMLTGNIGHVSCTGRKHPLQNAHLVFAEVKLTVDRVASFDGIAAGDHILIADVGGFLKLIPVDV